MEPFRSSSSGFGDLNTPIHGHSHSSHSSSSSIRTRHQGQHLCRLLLHRELGVHSRARVSNRLLGSWAERDFLASCSAQYTELRPVPRSTIAAAYSSDGACLASTHGDHTVKVISCHTGRCIQVLDGHVRTPWAVRFHPTNPNILASGSLDHHVVIWDVVSGMKLFSHDFGKPIASIAFHPRGNLVAVASGHKVYMWDYKQHGSPPQYILKTRKSMRAIHFHPTNPRLMLTAEVVERKPGGSNPPSAPTSNSEGVSESQQHAITQLNAFLRAAGQASQGQPLSQGSSQGGSASTGAHHGGPWGALPQARALAPSSAPPALPAAGGVPGHGGAGQSPLTPEQETVLWNLMAQTATQLPPSSAALGGFQQPRPRALAPQAAPGSGGLLLHQMGATSSTAASLPRHYSSDALQDGGSAFALHMYGHMPMQALQQETPPGSSSSTDAGMFDYDILDPAELWRLYCQGDSNVQPIPLVSQAIGQVCAMGWGWETSPSAVPSAPLDVEYSLPAAGPQELPCTVNVSLWRFDENQPNRTLEDVALLIPKVVLCSEMGAHFSQDGRMLVVCTADSTPSPECLEWQKRHAQELAEHNARRTAGLHGPGGAQVHSSSSDSVQAYLSMYRSVSAPSSATMPLPNSAMALGPGHFGGNAAAGPPKPRFFSGPDTVGASSSHQPGPPGRGPFSLAQNLALAQNLTQAGATARPLVMNQLEGYLGGATMQQQQQTPMMLQPQTQQMRSMVTHLQQQHEQQQQQAGMVASAPRTRAPGTGMGLGAMLRQSAAGSSEAAYTAPNRSSLAQNLQRSMQMQHMQQAQVQPQAFVNLSHTPAPAPPAHMPQYPLQQQQPQPAAAAVPLQRDPAAESGSGTASSRSRSVYELRIYSTDGPHFGQLLKARPIHAAHCLTSIQFSPSGDLLLVAYGRRHISLCSLVYDAGRFVPVHTIIEIYRVSDMSLVRVLPSLEDEVNVAAFHPFPGCGLAYGTKEGRLRILRHDRRTPERPTIPSLGRARYGQGQGSEAVPQASPLHHQQRSMQLEQAASGTGGGVAAMESDAGQEAGSGEAMDVN